MHTGCGGIGHPAFPTPSVFLGEKFLNSSGASRREIAKLRHTSAVIARERGRSSIPLLLVIESRSRGVLVPRFRGDDDCG
jgi:hypothetical protein